MCHGSEPTLWWMFMIPYWSSCEVSVALLSRPSCAREREGAYPCREDVCHVKQGADGSHSEPRGSQNCWVGLISRQIKCKCNNSVFGDWWIMRRWLMYFLFLFLFFLSGAEDVRRWSVSPPGVWMGGGVLRGEESRIEVNTGESFLFLFLIHVWWNIQSPSGVGGTSPGKLPAEKSADPDFVLIVHTNWKFTLLNLPNYWGAPRMLAAG